MRFRRAACLLSWIIVCAFWTSASAAETPKSTRVFLGFFGGYQTYGDGVTGGGFGGGIRVWPSNSLCILVDYTHLSASDTETGLVDDVPVELKAELPANVVSLTGGYFRTWRATHYGIGGGIGYYVSDGSLDVTVGNESASSHLDATAVGFHLLAMGAVAASSSARFEFAVGYRHAKTSDLTADGAPITLEDGSRLQGDWNGLMTRFGISVGFDPGPYPPTGP